MRIKLSIKIKKETLGKKSESYKLKVSPLNSRKKLIKNTKNKESKKLQRSYSQLSILSWS
jgi:hypothetical protein